MSLKSAYKSTKFQDSQSQKDPVSKKKKLIMLLISLELKDFSYLKQVVYGRGSVLLYVIFIFSIKKMN